jgi:hypothetical protein
MWFPRNLRKICEAFRPVTAEHIAVYGAYNDLRLTGKHETASIHDFSMEFLTEDVLYVFH